MRIANLIPNPLDMHRKHHLPSEKCYRQLSALKNSHYLATVTKGEEKEGFLRQLTALDAQLKQTNHNIATLKRKIADYKQKLRVSQAHSIRELFRRKIKMERREVKTLKEQKRFLKGDIHTLAQPENRFLFSMEQIHGVLAANKQKTIRKDRTIPRVCAYLGGFLGAAPATILAILSASGVAISQVLLIGATFLGSGGGGILGLMLEKPFRRLWKKFF